MDSNRLGPYCSLAAGPLELHRSRSSKQGSRPGLSSLSAPARAQLKARWVLASLFRAVGLPESSLSGQLPGGVSLKSAHHPAPSTSKSW